MRRACIDIGSNTTRLLVADCHAGGLSEVHQERAFTRLGQALDAAGELPAAKLQEVADAVSAQLASARIHGVTEVRCVATAGVRRARNGGQLISLIAELCEGQEVEVLSGEAEARLAFIGAAWGCSRAGGEIDGPLGVVDVGGGSSELVVGVPPDRVLWSRSIAIGSSDLTGAVLISDPPTAEECAHASGRVHELFAEVSPPPAAKVVAVGGSAASLTRIVGPSLDAESLGATLALLQERPAAVIAQRYQLDLQRVRLLPGGLLILKCMAEIFGVSLSVGGAGLREGLLLDAYQ